MANLITLDDYKTYKGINSTNEDSKVSAIIPLVSDFVKTFCNRSFIDYVSTEKVEWFSGNSASILVKEIPIISVSTVEISADNGDTLTTMATSAYILDEDLGKIYTADGLNFSENIVPVKGLKITYKAGYTDTPPDVALAVMDLIHHYSSEGFTTFKGIGSANIRSAFSRTKLPDHISRILEMWRLP